MSLHVVGSLSHISQPFRSIGDQKLLDEIFGDRVHMLWPLYPTAQYLLVDAKRVVIEKWRKPGQHFVDQNSERPPVYRLIVSFALNYLWCQILRRAAQSPRPTSTMTS